MPTFDTPEPILAVIEVYTGYVRINAGDRADTVVDVRPIDPAEESSVQAAERTRVEFSGGRLLVKEPRAKGFGSWLAWRGGIEVNLDLPSGSRVQASGAAEFLGTGRLGESVVHSSNGDIRLEETAQADLKAANGEISVDWVTGSAEIKSSNGAVRLGTVDGDVLIRSATGDVTVDRPLSDLTVKSAYGRVRVGEVTRGSTRLEIGYGKAHIGIADGTAAWLDLHSKHGMVRNELTASESPGEAGTTAEVRVRANYGDIDVHRS
ncbi:DUF4097 family beta strand repeat-containing protein [Spirillospora sp. NBC_00431]